MVNTVISEYSLTPHLAFLYERLFLWPILLKIANFFGYKYYSSFIYNPALFNKAGLYIIILYAYYFSSSADARDGISSFLFIKDTAIKAICSAAITYKNAGIGTGSPDA